MDEDELARELKTLLDNPDDEAARSHLAAGRPIYFSEDDTPSGYVVKQYPDGRRELVTFDIHGEHVARFAA